MVSRKYLAVGLTIIAAVAAFLILFLDWEVRAVKKQLRSLAREIIWTSADSELTMAVRVRHIQGKLVDTCLVEIPSYGISRSVDNQDVPTYMMMARNYYKNLSVKLEDLDVQSIEFSQAQAIATAYVRATGADGRRNDAVLALQFRLRKIGKQWQVTEAKEIEVLER